MYLSNLELVGFKSFAQKTSFRFTNGITVFVGPNGCGKTNIVDAVRWVLGEQKTSLLRSDVMENVIFCGSKYRKPIGMAEVSLTIQNNKQILPIEYSEVTITRRLFRNGESQYLINNTICRLRDILDLFMDTGIGSDSYSVIELKMVEELLNGKVEERRHILEEAAGVTKYKVRRKEADKKLVSVQADLIRLQDIADEVKKNVASLSRQAAKTRKYNQLIEEYKSLELELLKNQFLNITTCINKHNAELGQKKIEKSKSHNTIEELEDEIKNLDTELNKLNEKNIEARNVEIRLFNELSQMNKDLAVGEERIVSIDNSINKITKDIDEIKVNIENQKTHLSSLKNKYNNNKNELNIKSGNLEELKNLTRKLRSSLYQQKSIVNEKNGELQNINNLIYRLESLISKNKQRYSQNNLRIEESSEEIENIKKKIADLEIKQNSFKEKKEELVKSKNKLLEIYKENSKLKEELSYKIEKNLQTFLEIKSEISSKENTIAFLKNLISNDETTKFLIDTGEWLKNKEKLTLAEIIATDKEYSKAVESALGEASKWFVVDHLDEAQSAYFLLKENSKGKATFIILERIPKAQPLEEVVFQNKKIKWIYEIIRTERKVKDFLIVLLGKTCLVESEEDGFSIIENNIADIAVTLEGNIISRNGYIKWGTVTTTDNQIFGKKERINNLTSEIEHLKEKLSELDNLLSTEKDKFNSLDISLIENKLNSINEEINNNENLISQIKFQIESLSNKIELIEQNIIHLQKDNHQIVKENENAEKELSEQQNLIVILKEELFELNESLTIEEEHFTEKETNAHQQEIEIAKLQTEVKNIELEMINIEKQIKFSQDRLKDLEAEKQKAGRELENIKRRNIIIKEALQKTEAKYNEATGKREMVLQQINSKQEQLRQVSEFLTSERKSYSKIIDNIHQIELKISEYNAQLSIIEQKVQEDYQYNIHQSEIKSDQSFSIEETKEKLAILKEKLTSLGSVNFMALEEYEEQSQRLDFLQSQIQDLIDSEKTLQDTITEINQTAEEMFRKTFTEIKENFKMLFKKLFGEEGDAEIRLADENEPLESDIEIIAKPPGKKPHSIDVLSGGEKTLIAIALLFSIYLVKPSPFCILDEVDAPLDDTNIDKFLNLIKSFSNNTQFLIITHNKKTMESADALYGITMLEEGVSQVVSVKFAS